MAEENISYQYIGQIKATIDGQEESIGVEDIVKTPTTITMNNITQVYGRNINHQICPKERIKSEI